MRYTVAHPDRMGSFSFERILITSINSTEIIFQKIADMGLAMESVVQIS